MNFVFRAAFSLSSGEHVCGWGFCPIDASLDILLLPGLLPSVNAFLFLASRATARDDTPLLSPRPGQSWQILSDEEGANHCSLTTQISLNSNLDEGESTRTTWPIF